MKEVVWLLPSPGVDGGGAIEKKQQQQLVHCQECSFLRLGPVTCCSSSCSTCCLHGAKCHVCSKVLMSPLVCSLNLQQVTAAVPLAKGVQPGFHDGTPLLQLAAHDRTCEHHLLHCLVQPGTCSWHGERADLEAHTQAKHPQHFVRFPSTAGNSVSWRISKNGCCIDLVRHLVVALGEMFVYQKQFSYQERQLFIAIQLVGPHERSRLYRYKFRLTRSEGAHSVTFEHAVHSQNENLQRTFGLGDCIKVPYDTISQFCHGERVLILRKLEPPYEPNVETTHL
ncbi:E3 ubiquitin-protein ligase SIAH1A-like [Schistocerca cancellata]|uniref:E3 ubiquitin-protein ligase SIAH1A-like n=1 Tax=Schistocerca cancellata TaxID=274614 RepID=UPI00211856D1|nr:E3 ubiquitin-protein ligase SIAH1A-like [Schistocerca cancellata]